VKPGNPELADQVSALRDEVLAADQGEPPGSEVFDAVLRALSAGGPARARLPAGRAARPVSSDVDLALHDAIARRLAWRESELRVLGDAREVCRRVLAAAHRALSDPNDEMEVAQAVAEAGCSAARILVMLVVGRAARERAALLREEIARERLTQAAQRQREELVRLERALGRGASGS
jgi:hypothetical protein